MKETRMQLRVFSDSTNTYVDFPIYKNEENLRFYVKINDNDFYMMKAIEELYHTRVIFK